jgi:D-glycero-D-manno-heptose 1,7-bisphosphate phosphatase
MFPFAAGAIRRLNEAGLPVIVVTNQSAVASGYVPESLVREVHALMKQQLAEQGARVDAVYYCPHGSADGCMCRKPKPGLLEQAAREHGLDLATSFVVGDRYRDVETATAVGASGILVRTGYGEGELAWRSAKWPAAPAHVANDLATAADWILERLK